MWKNGKQHGEGYYKGSNGQEKKGEWRDGKRVKTVDQDAHQDEVNVN